MKLQKTAGGIILLYSQKLTSPKILEMSTCNTGLSQNHLVVSHRVQNMSIKNIFPSSSLPLRRCRYRLQLLLTYFKVPLELKSSLRLSSEIPFPRKTLAPSNSLAPLLHFPSTSAYTETRSPAFITAQRTEIWRLTLYLTRL